MDMAEMIERLIVDGKMGTVEHSLYRTSRKAEQLLTCLNSRCEDCRRASLKKGSVQGHFFPFILPFVGGGA